MMGHGPVRSALASTLATLAAAPWPRGLGLGSRRRGRSFSPRLGEAHWTGVASFVDSLGWASHDPAIGKIGGT